MTRRNWIARTRHASGRFRWVILLLGLGCTYGPPPSARAPRPAAAESLPEPVLAEGRISPAREARAAALYEEARSALEAGDAGRARQLAREVVETHPQAPVSGAALWLLARASLEAGDPVAAEEEAARYAGLLGPGDLRRAEALLLQADALDRQDLQEGRLQRLLEVGAEVPGEVARRVGDAAREAASRLDREALERVLGSAGSTGPAHPVVLARHAVLLQAAGAEAAAREAARSALEAGARGTDAVNAEAVLEGRRVAGPGNDPGGAILLGTVLPTGGSPAFRDFARSIAEGVEVAAAVHLVGVEVRVAAHDDGGSPARAASLAAELEAAGALGAIGFLEEGALDAAAANRREALPLVSPTARVVEGEAVYSLWGADPQGAAAMAAHAARAGFRRVAMIHSRSPESVEEAEAFESALRTAGVPLVGRFAYDAGSTYFQDQVRSAQEALRGAEIRALGLGPEDTLRVEMLEPVALFVPVPPEDVELLAPQITFFGLDTLGIRVLGTGGWTDPQALATVNPRHTTGVVATAPFSAGPGSPGYARFRQAYEGHFRRTLVSPVPALGWDAALLLLEAARGGARTPARLRAALEDVRGLEGATGIFSVRDGRVHRRTHVVLIEHGNLIPIG